VLLVLAGVVVLLWAGVVLLLFVVIGTGVVLLLWAGVVLLLFAVVVLVLVGGNNAVISLLMLSKSVCNVFISSSLIEPSIGANRNTSNVTSKIVVF